MRLSLCLAILVCLLPATTRSRPAPTEPATLPEIARGGGTLLTSSTTIGSALGRVSAVVDSFDLYGGPDRVVRDPDGIPDSGDEYVEGKFEDVNGRRARGLGPSEENWTGVDLTEVPLRGRVDAFNAGNLNGNGPGNLAYWFGAPAGAPETAGWSTPPGYGNRWRETLVFEAPVGDVSTGQTAGLDFFFNIDTEPAYDFFSVAYDSAGTWITVFEGDGHNRDGNTGAFEAPGLQYATLPDVRPIVYAGGDYPDDAIRIQFHFRSDTIFSDEDGLFPSDGAVQIDDVTITTRDAVFTEDFESGTPGILEARRSAFVGDFSAVYPLFADIDPCAENGSPVVGFIDFGQDVPNGPTPDGTTNTGGTTSPSWDYGIPGGYVVNRTGGLDPTGQESLDNEIWNPAFDWDLPGTEDDAVDVVGALLSFSVWRHNPLPDGIFYTWHVRAERGGEWGPWENRNLVYWSTEPHWTRDAYDVTSLLPPGPERIQIALGVVDLASVFGFPGTDSTPSPIFDDVRFTKFGVGGPVLSADELWLPQDAFPASGEIASETAAERDALDVRFDMARDVGTGSAIVSGDSIVVEVDTPIPNTSLADLRLRWILRQNPEFEADLRSPPSRPVDEAFATWDEDGTTFWSGEVRATETYVLGPGEVWPHWFVDLPDEDFLYPGDVLRFHWRATDSDGRVSTLPADVSGFEDWTAFTPTAYDRRFTMRALPTLYEAFSTVAGNSGEAPAKKIGIPDAPNLLIVDDTGGGQDAAETLVALHRLRYREGLDFDVYTVRAPARSNANGIGAAATPTPLGDRRGPGATPLQLSYYDGLLYLADGRTEMLLSDGSDDGFNDKSRDVQLLNDYVTLPGLRVVVVLGDNVASALERTSPVLGAAYVAGAMGVEVLDHDVSTYFGGALDLTVEGVLIENSFVAIGSCPFPATFDALAPRAPAQTGWRYIDPRGGTPVGLPVAGVVHDRAGPLPFDRRINVTLPFSASRIGETDDELLTLLDDVLVRLTGVLVPRPIDAPPAARGPSFSVFPNPFNPATTVSFSLPRAGMEAAVVVYDLRGRRVRVLHDGTAEVADLVLAWNGTDDHGTRVASGVYLVRATTEDFRRTRKIALVE